MHNKKNCRCLRRRWTHTQGGKARENAQVHEYISPTTYKKCLRFTMINTPTYFVEKKTQNVIKKTGPCTK